MATRLLVFPSIPQMRVFFQRREWQALSAMLYPLGPHHWRLPTGDEVFVLTASNQQTPFLLRREGVCVYLFLGEEPVPPRVTYLLQMLETMQLAGLVEVITMTHPDELQWNVLGFLSGPSSSGKGEEQPQES